MTLAPEPRARLSRRPSFPLAQAGHGRKRGRSAVRRSPVLAIPAAQVQSNSALCTGVRGVLGTQAARWRSQAAGPKHTSRLRLP